MNSFFWKFFLLGWAMITITVPLQAQEPATASPEANERLQRREEMRRKMENLTVEQREEIRKFREKAASMTPTERQQAMAKLPIYAEMPERRREMLAILWGGGTLRRPPAVEGTSTTLHPPPDPTAEQEKELLIFQNQWKGMTPDQRVQAASRLSVIREMTTEQRQWMKDRLQRLQQMSPAEREKLQKNFEKWLQMTPDEREAARKQLAARKISS